MTYAENGVDLVVGQRPVSRRHGAEHLGVQVDLIERDGIVDAMVKVFSHRSTSIASLAAGDVL